MDKRAEELSEVIADLRLIKEAVSKGDSILRFIDTGWAIRSVLLLGGLMVAFFSGIFYILADLYGSFAAAPLSIRITYFVLIGLAWCSLGCLKMKNFMKGARGISEDITLNRFFNEVYTSRLLALLIPFLLVTIMITVFLCSRGEVIYIAPTLSILFGLLFISMNPIFYLREIYFLSIWLIATGVLTLFTANLIHPTAVLVLTFSVGFILAALLLYLNLPGQKLNEE